MTYEALKEIMNAYRVGVLTKSELAIAIGLWQLKTYGEIA